MSDFSALNVAQSGLQVSQDGLDVVGQNVSNANTVGYTRQVLDQQAIPPDSHPGFDNPILPVAGNGAAVIDISRLSDAYLSSRSYTEHGNQGGVSAIQTGLAAVQQVFPEPGANGIAATMGNFWSSWGALASSPTGSTGQSLRPQVLTQAQTLAEAFNSAATQLKTIGQTTADNLGATVTQVNQWAQQVAKLNLSIRQGSAAGLTVNELEDQRDQLVGKISNDVNLSTATNSDGTVDVYVGTRALVSGSSAEQMSYSSANYGSTQQVSLSWSSDGTAVQATGGTIGGTVTFLSPPLAGTGTNSLAYYRAELDHQAANLANAINYQQSAGLDAGGHSGAAIFGYSTTDPSTNVGAATTLKVVMTDPSQLAAAGATAGGTDNQNAIAFSQLANNSSVTAFTGYPSTPGSTASVAEPDGAYTTYIGNLGSAAQNYNGQLTQQGAVTAQADAALQSQTGVNINEELTNMLMYQHAYEASGKFESVVSNVLQTLINDL